MKRLILHIYNLSWSHDQIISPPFTTNCTSTELPALVARYKYDGLFYFIFLIIIIINHLHHLHLLYHLSIYHLKNSIYITFLSMKQQRWFHIYLRSFSKLSSIYILGMDIEPNFGSKVFIYYLYHSWPPFCHVYTYLIQNAILWFHKSEHQHCPIIIKLYG